jgi:hypothetical protein
MMSATVWASDEAGRDAQRQGSVKLPLAKARGLGACRTSLRDSRRCQVGNGYSIPGLASAFSTVIRATGSDAKSDVGKGKAPPSRRFKSVRCRSQERLCTCPSISRLDRIETTILDVPRQKGGTEYKSRPTRVPSGNWRYRCLSGFGIGQEMLVAPTGFKPSV